MEEKEIIDRYVFLLHAAVLLIKELAAGCDPLLVAKMDPDILALSKGMELLAEDMEGG